MLTDSFWTYIPEDEEFEVAVNEYGGKAAGLAKLAVIKNEYGNAAPYKTSPAYVIPVKESIKVKEQGIFPSNDPIILRAIGFQRHFQKKVSVRSGAPVSMPGMMDTILNVGALEKTGSSFELDCAVRFLQMYGKTVAGIDAKEFQRYIDAANIYSNGSLYGGAVLEALYKHFLEIYREKEINLNVDTGKFIHNSINAVFQSYYNERAVQYRELEGIPETGTAVIIQHMVYGNLGDNSCTGVVFSHNPNTGEEGLYGEFIKTAQGEDVVAGNSITSPIKDMNLKLLKDLTRSVETICDVEKGKPIDVEFTVEDGELYILQYRKAKISTRAKVRLIVDSVMKKNITPDHAVSAILEAAPAAAEDATSVVNAGQVLGKGLGVTSGKAAGMVVTTKDMAEWCVQNNEAYIFVATETTPDNVWEIKNSVGILTAVGGTLSHAAVVARGWNKECVVSFKGMEVTNEGFKYEGNIINNKTQISIDGATGEVFLS